MNKQIAELAKKAGYDENNAEQKQQLANSGFNLELFAFLVAEKCGEITEEPEHVGRRDLDWSMVFKDSLGLPQNLNRPKRKL